MIKNRKKKNRPSNPDVRVSVESSNDKGSNAGTDGVLHVTSIGGLTRIGLPATQDDLEKWLADGSVKEHAYNTFVVTNASNGHSRCSQRYHNDLQAYRTIVMDTIAAPGERPTIVLSVTFKKGDPKTEIAEMLAQLLETAELPANRFESLPFLQWCDTFGVWYGSIFGPSLSQNERRLLKKDGRIENLVSW